LLIALLDRDGALLVFLECIGAAAEDRAGLALGEADLFADAPDVGAVQQVGLVLELSERFIRHFHVVAGVNALAGFVAVPARHRDSGRLALVTNRHRTGVPHHRQAGFRTDGGGAHLTSP
jgi:hypothetical protein